jgi:hypothetical protein
MRRPRMTTRRWMIATAFAAILIGVSPLRQRSVRYRQEAMRHALLAIESTENAEISRAAGLEHPEITRLMERHAAQWERIAVWHADLAEKYNRAASRPWETLPPDPPEPMPVLAPPNSSHLPLPAYRSGRRSQSVNHDP